MIEKLSLENHILLEYACWRLTVAAAQVHPSWVLRGSAQRFVLQLHTQAWQLLHCKLP